MDYQQVGTEYSSVSTKQNINLKPPKRTLSAYACYSRKVYFLPSFTHSIQIQQRPRASRREPQAMRDLPRDRRHVAQASGVGEGPVHRGSTGWGRRLDRRRRWTGSARRPTSRATTARGATWRRRWSPAGPSGWRARGDCGRCRRSAGSGTRRSWRDFCWK